MFGSTRLEVSNCGEWKSDLGDNILRFQRARSLVLNSETLKSNREIRNEEILYIRTLPIFDQKLRIFQKMLEKVM